jgi:hypothetical protein
MASFDTLQALAEHPDWLPPRSDLRVFVGEPGAPEANKTTVEPGNVFSPGMYTFGVTWWARMPESGSFFATESAALEDLCWSYESGFLPMIQCKTDFEGLQFQHSLFQDGTMEDRSESVCARLGVVNETAHTQSIQLFVALRSLGPAGAPVTDLCVSSDGRSFLNRTRPVLAFAETPSAIGCGIGDPSPLARQGTVPIEVQVKDADGWCFGVARFDVVLAKGESYQLHLDCPHQTYGSLSQAFPSAVVPAPERFEERAHRHLQGWRDRLSRVQLDIPDTNFVNAFFAGLQHMLVATVGEQARIAPLSYPLPWLRDSVYIIRCFDLSGHTEIARVATNYCARNDFFGGFGAEGDAPGQGIWALVEHYRFTRDKNWLSSVYPAIQRKCDWLFRMRRTTEPIRVVVDTPVLAFTHAHRASGIICLAAKDGIIMGSMDHGIDYALGWVNHWALAGLREAAYAACELGYEDDARKFQSEADELLSAYERYVGNNPKLLTEERTVNSPYWSSRAWYDAQNPAVMHDAFKRWWQTNRYRDGVFTPEPYWLYFEFAQAHNALLMGDPEPAWQVLDYRLKHQDLPGLYGWREGGNGIGTENAVNGVTLIRQIRGCQKFDSITPHGWSQAELWLLQRALLVEEWDQGLMLLGGVPRHWLKPDAKIAFRHFPTWYGSVSVEMTVDSACQHAIVAVSGVEPGTPIRIMLRDEQYIAAQHPLSIQVPLD